MAKLDELEDDVQVAWFGSPWDSNCTPDIQVPVPEEELCRRCSFAIGHGTAGACIRDAEDQWHPYHRDCYWELEEEREAAQAVREGLSAED